MIKPNLVMLHGWGFNSAIWNFNKEYLSQIYNLHTVDLLGHGNEKYDYDLHSSASYLEYFINNVTPELESFHVLGWSLGGNIALNLKHKYPEKVDKVILCCSNPCFVARENWLHGVDQKSWLSFEQKLLADQSKAINEFLLLQVLHHKDSKNLYRELQTITNNSPAASMQGLKWGLDILRSDHRHLLDKIDQDQIKFIFGDKDLLVNKSLKSWLGENYPKIQIDSFASSGHMPFITDLDAFYKSLDFFNSEASDRGTD